MIELNKIYNEDCLQTLSRMDDNSIDLVVTSPPYNKNTYASASGDDKSWGALRGRQIAYDTYDDAMSPKDYENWQRKILTECLRVLKPTGSIFYNHKDILVDGLIVSPKFIYDFQVHQQIVWNRGSSLANDPHYFQPITEYIYWIVKNPKGFYFDKSQAIFRQTVWNINFEINTDHPAPFPVKLAQNCVKVCTPSHSQSIVYDPFMGSASTAIAAIREKRSFVGSEFSPKYCEWANKRIQIETSQLTLF